MQRAVLIEDSTELRDLTRMCLELDGGTQIVGEAADGASGLAVINGTQPDVAIVDLHLPSMGGIELIRELRAQGSDLRVVAYSCDQFALDKAWEAGADTLVVKTGDMNELVIALNGVG